MKSILRYSGPVRLSIIISFIFFTLQMAAQQNSQVPGIRLISPAKEDSLTNSSMLLLRAEIVSSSPIISYKIYNNREAYINESGKNLKKNENSAYLLESNVELKKGQNIIYIEAKNETTTLSSDKITVTSQIEPFIRWISPVETGSTVQTGEVTLKAEIRTLLPIRDLKINLNGTSLASEKDTYKSTGTEKYIFEKTLQLSRGRNTISITCSNARGNTTSANRIVTNKYTSNPVVKIINPSAADSLNNSGRITLTATIDSKLPVKSFRVYRNEETVFSESNTKLEKQDSNIYLLSSFLVIKKGMNDIYITATNESGQGTSEWRTVNCQLEPFVTWLKPGTENSTIESENITIRAEVKSAFPLKQTIINVNGIPVTDEKASVNPPEKDTYSLEKSIQLKPGKNTIFITSVNSKGETKSLIRYVNCTAGATPLITLISPTPKDSLSISGLATVNAEIVSRFDLQTYRVFNNRNAVLSDDASTLQKKDSITYILKSFVPLQAGSNTIFVEARNSAGTGTSVRRNITCRLEPLITWVIPSSVTSNFDASTLNLRAEISSSFDLSAVRLNINGSSTTIDKESLKRVDNLTWVLEKSVTLDAGPNSLMLTADNIRGSGRSAVRSVNYVPGDKPEIRWILPVALASETDKAEFQLSASITAKSQVRSTKLFINGTEVTAGNNPRISPKSSGEYLYENSLILKPGENAIRLSASTDAATVNSEERVVNFTAPVLPALVWKSPTPDNMEVHRPSVDLKMEIGSKAALKNVAVYLNGKAVDNINLQNSVRKENDSFVLENTIPIGPGENKIYITATNNAGMMRSDTRSVKYVVPAETVVAATTAATKIPETTEKKATETKEQKVTQPPVIQPTETKPVAVVTPSPPLLTWISPSIEKNNVTEASVRIKAKINSPVRIQSVLLYVNGVASEMVNQLASAGTDNDYIMEKLINLNPGDNSIYFVATNSVTSQRSDLRYLTYPVTTKPVVTWTIPSGQNKTVNNNILVIEACIKSATELKSVKVFVDGEPMGSESFFDAAAPGDCNYKFTKAVILKEGENNISILAENLAGGDVSEPRIVYYGKALIAEKRIALVIGNADYKNSNALKNPVNDANLMESTLKSLNFEVIKRVNATQDQMKEAIKEFRVKLPAYNVALFYYAGHGIQVGNLHYMLPVDIKLDNPADCDLYAVEVETIQRQFEEVPENTNIIILDACRDNPFKTWTRGGAPEGFKPLSPVSGTLIAYATEANATAADGPSDNGIYTQELVKQMLIPQSIHMVFTQTANQVKKITNNKQSPRYDPNLTGDFWFKK